jgi:hypothetical protein
LIGKTLSVEEVQPVIERERQQTEIRQVIAPSKERVAEEATVEHRTAPLIEKPVEHVGEA